MWWMRRIAASEGPQLWHKQHARENGKYITYCGLRYGLAGAASKVSIPAGACARCLKADKSGERK